MRTLMLAAAVALAGGAYAIAAGPPSSGAGTIQACAAKSGVLRLVAAKTKCRRGERRVTWAVSGPPGVQGLPGRDGSAGQPGPQGPGGDQGAQGVPGQEGDQGDPGARGSDAQFNGAAAAGDLTGTYPAPTLAPSEPWHVVGATGQPPFASGWSNYGGSFSTAGFYRDRAGVVHLRGLVAPGSTGANSAIFTLPAGYRPDRTSIFVVDSRDATITSGRVDIYGSAESGPGGRIAPFVSSTAYLSLDGVTFRCGPSGANGCP